MTEEQKRVLAFFQANMPRNGWSAPTVGQTAFGNYDHTQPEYWEKGREIGNQLCEMGWLRLDEKVSGCYYYDPDPVVLVRNRK